MKLQRNSWLHPIPSHLIDPNTSIMNSSAATFFFSFFFTLQERAADAAEGAGSVVGSAHSEMSGNLPAEQRAAGGETVIHAVPTRKPGAQEEAGRNFWSSSKQEYFVFPKPLITHTAVSSLSLSVWLSLKRETDEMAQQYFSLNGNQQDVAAQGSDFYEMEVCFCKGLK